MDISFVKEKEKLVVIYMDVIIVYSRSDKEHVKHLEKVFLKCKKYGISLNPRKSNFALEEGKILGHIISRDGINIDPQRVSAIQKVEDPRSKKEVHSFIRQVNFLRRFIPSFVEMLMNITNMLKKDHEIKWKTNAGRYFREIKESIT